MTESSKRNKQFTRESIIGLGEDSFRKNYYPELQSKILDLERINARNKIIINTIPDILLVSDAQGNISPFTFSKNTNPFLNAIISDSETIGMLRDTVKVVAQTRQMITKRFGFIYRDDQLVLEVRMNLSDTNEILLMIRDVTESVRMEERLRDMVNRDDLTGLYNRRVFEERMAYYETKNCSCLTVIILDIDGLKMMNDTFGHLSGDEVIKTSAKFIVDSVTIPDATIARLSGDEFGILMETWDEQVVTREMHSVMEKVADYNDKSELIQISLSYGYAIHDGSSGKINMTELFSEADNFMYQHKMLKSESARSGLVKTLMKALEERDFITEGHADRMEDLVFSLGDRMQLSRIVLDKLKLLAKFHDIGKVGIPDRILNKPGKLDPDEYKIMKTHSQIGKRIADVSKELKDISDLILYHHERWDGNGYPEKLTGDLIPIECRILAIVDTYDAMTNDRPYRKALSKETAFDEIIRCSGSQFDPQIVDEFLAMMGYNGG